MPSKDEAIHFYSKYKASNIKLNDTFNVCNKYNSIFDEDFSAYPDKAADLWDEDSSNQAIINIFKSIKPLEKMDPEILIQSAIALEKNNLKLSFQLMLMAKSLRPDGPFIKRKVEAYNKLLAARMAPSKYGTAED